MVSYRCIYRTQVEEETCHFNINEDVEQIEGEEDEPITIKLTVQNAYNSVLTGLFCHRRSSR